MLAAMRLAFIAATVMTALLLAAGPAAAASICWKETAPSTGGQWNMPENWMGDSVPGPGDTVVLNVSGGGCSMPADIVLSGVSAEVALVQQAATTIVVDGPTTALTLTGVSQGAHVLGSVQVRNGAALTIATDADIPVGGTITLGNPGTGSLLVDGTLRAYTGTLNITDEPSGGGTVAITAAGGLIYNPGNSGVVRAQFDNDGTVAVEDDAESLSSQLSVYPSAGSTSSDGSFAIGGLSTLGLRPTRGSTMTVAGSITGPGALDISQSAGPAGTGTVSMPTSATLAVGKLTIGSPSALDLAAAGNTGRLEMAGTGERDGPGTLTALSATLEGGVFAGGLTRITGAATISAPAIRGAATLRTDGATTWSGGAVVLGAAGPGGRESGTWENAGHAARSTTPTRRRCSSSPVTRPASCAISLERRSTGARRWARCPVRAASRTPASSTCWPGRWARQHPSRPEHSCRAAA